MFKKGFTLIELLVVIAIIAILAAILFPVFAQAREKARQTSCLSNCKQIGTALQLYTDDYDETLPYPGYTDWRGWGDSQANFQANYADYPANKLNGVGFNIYGGGYKVPTWADRIFPYVKNTNMYVCPSGIKNVMGYGINAGLYSDSGTFGQNYINNNCAPVPTLTQISKTAETVFVCDNIQKNDINVVGLSANVYNMRNFNNAGSPYVKACRHNGGANFTMVDGHAKFYKDGQGPLQCSLHTSQDAYDDRNYYWWDIINPCRYSD